MKNIKNTILTVLLLLPLLLSSQSFDDMSIRRADYKDITGHNTVSITTYVKDGKNLVYVGGFGDVDVYSLDKNGKLTPLFSQELYKKKGPARGMVADRIGGNDFLFVANKLGDVIEVFKISSDGTLARVFMMEDTPETYIGTAITLQVVHMKKASYLFAGGLEETPGLSCYKIHEDGKLSHVQSMKDDETIHTDGIIGMFVHKIDGKTFLYTGGFQDNGVSSFRVYENGHFKNINNIDDNDTDRYLTGTYPVTGVTMGNNHYVIVGHRHHKYYTRKGFIKRPDFVYHGDAVSVFKVNKKGELIPHSVLKDDERSKLAGQTRIEVVSVTKDSAIIAVGTRDDASIQLCKLNAEGMLSPLNYLETGYTIYYALRSHRIGEQNFLLAGSNQFDMKRVVAYKLTPKEVSTEGKVIKHVQGFKFKEDADPEKVQDVLEIVANLKNVIPGIAQVEWGKNNSTEGLSERVDYVFTFTFKDDNAREVFIFHPAHIAAENKMKPLLDDVYTMDYWTD